ncbi:uncharacterized protein LOC121748143 [Salvia splendens]|uniref:uncharacterized protein LOC121748143 n=1 Tax=Salvia splendens TaxID=180675 RepID=UPI001C255C9C|nr:uncharacterized protein LOC121748143 [Salvia splendens]
MVCPSATVNSKSTLVFGNPDRPWTSGTELAPSPRKRPRNLTSSGSPSPPPTSPTSSPRHPSAPRSSPIRSPLRFPPAAVANLSDVVSEASKRSKELAAEALKRADQITAQIPPAAAAITNLVDSKPRIDDDADLEKYGVTDELRDFVKEITINTFQDFPLEDDSGESDVPMVSNIRQDLTEWQEKHAKLVLLTVKEVSKLRYQLCPRVMKERKFWRIFFILVKAILLHDGDDGFDDDF